MRILVACEFSGIVRDAFAAKGHEAWSCDILPTERPGNHYQGDVFDIIGEGWDLMIAHPPCTFLSYAGNGYWNEKGRIFKRLQALTFFANLWEADITRICIENPLGCADKVIKKHDQIINPYNFGDSHLKRTCIWLKNLPLLVHSDKNLFSDKTSVDKPKPIYIDKNGKKRHFTDSISGGKGQGKKRSISFQGIANAMADQWNFLL